MNAILSILSLIADLLRKFIQTHEATKAQERADDINRNPSDEFVRRFKRTETTNPVSKPTKHDS